MKHVQVGKLCNFPPPPSPFLPFATFRDLLTIHPKKAAPLKGEGKVLLALSREGRGGREGAHSLPGFHSASANHLSSGATGVGARTRRGGRSDLERGKFLSSSLPVSVLTYSSSSSSSSELLKHWPGSKSFPARWAKKAATSACVRGGRGEGSVPPRSYIPISSS